MTPSEAHEEINIFMAKLLIGLIVAFCACYEKLKTMQNLIAFGGFLYYSSFVFSNIIWKQENNNNKKALNTSIRSLILFFSF